MQPAGGAQTVQVAAAAITNSHHTTRHLPPARSKRDCKIGCKCCNLCHKELDLSYFGVLASGSHRAYCVDCHPIVSSGSKKGLRVQDLRAAYHDGTLDTMLIAKAPSAVQHDGTKEPALHHAYECVHEYDSDSREHQEQYSSE